MRNEKKMRREKTENEKFGKISHFSFLISHLPTIHYPNTNGISGDEGENGEAASEVGVFGAGHGSATQIGEIPAEDRLR